MKYFIIRSLSEKLLSEDKREKFKKDQQWKIIDKLCL